MSTRFNLVDEGWIPCIRTDGTVRLEGILRALAGAGHYLEVRDSSPLVTVALYRTLLAVLHRVFGPSSPEDWADLWKNGLGRFDKRRLEAYLKDPVIHSRFDLFDAVHPFYQMSSLPLGPLDGKTGRPKFVKPIWQMAHDLAYSDSMNLFAHYPPNHWETRAADEAARWLVAFQAFALGGRIATEEGRRDQDGSAPSGQLVKSAVVLARGENLFQTLMLNLLRYSASHRAPFPFDSQADRPAWERDDEQRLQNHQFERRCEGYLDLLTWQSRRVNLLPERDSTGNITGVSGVVIMKGFHLPRECRWSERETMVAFRNFADARGKLDPWVPLGFRVGYDLWREMQALFQDTRAVSRRPRTLAWLDELLQAGYLNARQIRLDLAGMATEQAKVFFWRHQTLPLPLAYVDRRKVRLVESLGEMVRLAERVAKTLRDSLWRAALTASKPDPGETQVSKAEHEGISRVAQSFRAEPLYWSQVEKRFWQCLEELSPDEVHRSGTIRTWLAETLQPAAWDAYRRTAGEMEHSSRALQAAVSGEALLARSLARIAADYRFIAGTQGKEAADATAQI